MKLRSVMFVGALAAMSAASAGTVVNGSNICGLQLVPSDATTTIIAVPWLGVGGGNVKVCDLVKTDTLSNGDMLFYYNGTSYSAWEVYTDGTKKWRPVATASTQDGISYSAGDAEQTIPRGKALFLRRQTPATSPIYLYGQYLSTAISVSATSGDKVYTLMANPTAATVDLNNKMTGGTPNQNDVIEVPGNDGSIEKRYTYESGKWGYSPSTGGVTVGGISLGGGARVNVAEIPAGRGFWYISNGGSATFSF